MHLASGKIVSTLRLLSSPFASKLLFGDGWGSLMSDQIHSKLSDEAKRLLEADPVLVLDKVIVLGAKAERLDREENARRLSRTCVIDVSLENIGKNLDLPNVITRKFTEYWRGVTSSRFRSYLLAIEDRVNGSRDIHNTSSVIFDLSVSTKYGPANLSISDLYFDVLGQLLRDKAHMIG